MPNNKKPAFTTAKATRALKKAAKDAGRPSLRKHIDQKIKLSPYNAHSGSFLNATEKGAGTYHRSGQHPLTRQETEHKKRSHQLKELAHLLKYGKRAHIGFYWNNFDRLGNRPWGRKHKKASVTTKGDALLYDNLLIQRKNICLAMANQLTKLKCLKVRYLHRYPCLMIYVKKNTVFTDYRKPTDASLKAWSDFLLSYLQGALNANAKHRGIPIESVSRASFGFLSTTLAQTGESIRLNTGIIPKLYQDCIVETLRQMDATLARLKTDIANQLPIPEDCFYNSDKFVNYRGEEENFKLDNLVELLWEHADTTNKTTIYNIMRSIHAKEGVIKMVFETLCDDHANYDGAMIEAITWATSKLFITDKPALSFDQNEDLDYTIPFDFTHHDETWYDDFWGIIYHLYENLSNLEDNQPILTQALATLKTAWDEANLVNLYAKLEYVQDALLIQACIQSTELEFEDGYGSDSEIEEEIEGKKIYGKKIITNNGMRAIVAALIGVSSDDALKRELNLLIDNGYYETYETIKLLQKINGIAIRQKKDLAEANVCFTDATPCITTHNREETTPHLSDEMLPAFFQKIVIIDVTSCTTDEMNRYAAAFAKSRSNTLYMVSSGAKNEQIGSDNNSYGTVRIFCKSKAKRDLIYNHIRAEEDPVQSSISHQSRRQLKMAGAVPTNAAILRPRF